MKECKNCNTDISHRHINAKYCSNKCRDVKRLKPKTKKTCSYCKSTFETAVLAQRWCKNCKEGVSERQLRAGSKEGRLSSLLSLAKNRAATKGLCFNLDLKYLLDLWDNQEGKCALSGRGLDLLPSNKKRQVNPNAPSLDRIVPEKGYVKGNIRILTYHCNVCVNEYGDKVLYDLIKDIVDQKRRSSRR